MKDMADFTATVNVDINDSQLTSVEQRLDALNNKKVTVNLDGLNNIQNQLNQLNNIKIDKLNVNTGTITQTFNRVGQNAGRSFANSFKNGISDLNMQRLTTGISELETKFQSLGDKGSSFSQKLAQLRSEIENFDRSATPKQQEQMFRQLETELSQMNLKYRELNAEAKSAAQSMSMISGKNILGNQIQTWMNNNTKAAKVYATQLEQLQQRLKSVSSKSELSTLRQDFLDLKSAASAEGITGKGFFGTLFSNMTKISPLFGMGAMIATGIREIKNMYNSVVELDTALVDLKKTTTMSSSDLEAFYGESNNIAKQLGVTTAEIINQASAWSRLGYSSKEDAQTMAKLSSQFAAISPGMDTDQATDGLVSIMKAFDVDPSNVLDGVMSKINQIGNTAATSNQEIVEMLSRSSSAMAEANNSLEQTIALETAAVEITRDPASVGTAFKTIAMRIRGYDEETESYSNDVEVLSGKVADLTKTASTPGGLSLFTDETKTEYKSTYQLLDEISQIYDQLTDKQQAGLLEVLAGKRQGQIVAATINNFDAARKAMDEMANSAGSADREMGIIQESIEYKINALKETGVGIAQNLFQRDTVGGVVEDLTGILNVIDTLTEKLGLLGTVGAGLGIAALVKDFGK